MRLCHPDEDRSLEALAQRVRQLEARLEGSPASSAPGSAPRPPPPPVAAAPVSAPPSPAPSSPASPSLPSSPAASPVPSSPAAGHGAPSPDTAEAASAPAARPAVGDRPAAAARKTLSEHRSAATARQDAAASPAPPPGPAVPPPPVPVPDLGEMQPRTPTEVVDWARRHLGLDRSFVVARATDLEPDQERRREPAQLQALWKDLVVHAVGPAPSEEAVAPPVVEGPLEAVAPPVVEGPLEAVAPPVVEGPLEAAASPDIEDPPKAAAPPEEEAVDGFDLADLDDLAEAPSHAHDIEEKIKATFPGTELTLLPEPDGDNAGGQT